jgi:hypothetical protein
MLSVGYNKWLSVNIAASDATNFTTPLRVQTNISDDVDDMPFIDAAARNARLISEKYSNIHVMLSGGLDSEFVAKTFLDNRLPFTPVIVLLPHCEGEAWYAFKFCEENNLTPMIVDYTDPLRFESLVSSAVKKAHKFNIYPVLATLLNCIIDADLDPSARVVNGFGEPFLDEHDYRSRPIDIFEMSHNQHQIEIEFDDKHPGAFFTYTPELFKACLVNADTSLHCQSYKAKLYNLLPRSKIYVEYKRFVENPKLKYLLEKYTFPKDHPEYLFLQMPKQQWLSLFKKAENV